MNTSGHESALVSGDVFCAAGPETGWFVDGPEHQQVKFREAKDIYIYIYIDSVAEACASIVNIRCDLIEDVSSWDLLMCELESTVDHFKRMQIHRLLKRSATASETLSQRLTQASLTRTSLVAECVGFPFFVIVISSPIL